jgi:hypothetical protein
VRATHGWWKRLLLLLLAGASTISQLLPQPLLRQRPGSGSSVAPAHQCHVEEGRPIAVGAEHDPDSRRCLTVPGLSFLHRGFAQSGIASTSYRPGLPPAPVRGGSRSVVAIMKRSACASLRQHPDKRNAFAQPKGLLAKRRLRNCTLFGEDRLHGTADALYAEARVRCPIQGPR